MYGNPLSLRSYDGQRKYLNQKERMNFLEVTKKQPLEIRLFCQLLYYTGARIAEIHNLTINSIDLSNGTLVIESLKKRRQGIYREIPLPQFMLQNLRDYARKQVGTKNIQLWPFSLRTASRKISQVMKEANIRGVRACSRGLRHGFAAYAVTKVPLTMVKKWLGHSSLETTEIYLELVGAEERQIARRIWSEKD